jgi:hypothetical protein
MVEPGDNPLYHPVNDRPRRYHPSHELRAAAAAGPAAVAAELTGRIRAELPVIGALGERDQVLVAAWLTGLRSPRTRRAYAGDLVAWLG